MSYSVTMRYIPADKVSVVEKVTKHYLRDGKWILEREGGNDGKALFQDQIFDASMWEVV